MSESVSEFEGVSESVGKRVRYACVSLELGVVCECCLRSAGGHLCFVCGVLVYVRIQETCGVWESRGVSLSVVFGVSSGVAEVVVWGRGES